MQNTKDIPSYSNPSNQQITDYYEGLISYLRSRLNVISTSVYLLQTSDRDNRNDDKYLVKIDKELETIRKLLNA